MYYLHQPLDSLNFNFFNLIIRCVKVNINYTYFFVIFSICKANKNNNIFIHKRSHNNACFMQYKALENSIIRMNTDQLIY